MDYKKHYDALVSNAHKLNETRFKHNEYYEKHHIVPRSMGGSESSSNIIKLTAREHFLAHHLLYKIYGGGMAIAFKMMNGFTKYGHICKLTSVEYEKLRIAYAKEASIKQIKRFENPIERKKLSDNMLNKWHSVGTRQKMLDMVKSPERRKKTSTAIKNWIINNPEEFSERMDKINHNPEKIKKMADKHRGMKRSDECKSNMRESKKKFLELNGSESIGKGCKYIHNTITFERKRVPSDHILEENWKWGLGKQNKDKPKGINQFIKNELTREERSVPKGSELPIGWQLGRLTKRKGNG